LQDEKAAARSAPGAQKSEAAPNALGLRVTDLTAQQKRDLKLAGGVLVEAAQGPAATAGVLPGDLILQINNVQVTNAAQFNAVVTKLEPKKSVAVLVQRENVTQYLVIKPRQ
jgi:serine protease Do